VSVDPEALKPIIARIAAGENLSEAETERAFTVMMTGAATHAQMGGLLTGMRVRGETVDEIAGAARAMRAQMTAIDAPEGAIDTCGTGGDGAGTYNVSTAAALVVAAAGVPVAKHGNRAQSSSTGAADVLEALGVKVDAGPERMAEALRETGTCFLLAPAHHGAMRHVAPVRKELGTRTIFNLLGPLSNPARVRRQVIGVFAREWVEPLAHVLRRLGHERAWVVHGLDGLDELSTTGPSLVAELKDGAVRTFEVTPEDAGLRRESLERLRGGDAEANARAIRAVLAGESGPLRDIVLMAAGAGLVVADRAADLREGVAQAAEAVDSGRARAVLERFAAVTERA